MNILSDNIEVCRIIVKGGMHLLCMPDGTTVPNVIMTRVTDDINSQTVAIVKLFVRLEPDE